MAFLFIEGLVLALISGLCIAAEISGEPIILADLTPNARIEFRKALSREIKLIMEAVEKEFVSPVERNTLMQNCVIGGGSVATEQEKATVAYNRFLLSLDDLDTDSAREKMLSCVNNMLKQSSPESKYYAAEEIKKQQAKQQTIAGIGLAFTLHENGCEIIFVFDDSSAQMAGLRSGDVITKIDGASLQGIKLEDIKNLILGKIGSVSELTISRPGLDLPMNLALSRIPFDPGGIESKLLSGGVAYLKILHLGSSTLNRAADSINDLRKRNNGPLRGSVIDLRHCRGGLLYVAVGFSAIFLSPDSPVAEIRGRTSQSALKLNATKSLYVKNGKLDPLTGLPNETKSMPIVVISGPETAAGGEIIASALQDNKRAVVIGSPTSKKGTVETHFPIIDFGGILKITTGKIFRPRGSSLDELAVTPDILLDTKYPTIMGGSDLVLDHAVARLEEIIQHQ